MRRVCYRFYRGMTCKFGDQCRHAHLEKGSAACREFEQNPAEMERYNAWLELQKDASEIAGSPKAKPDAPPAAHAAEAKATKKKKKKKKELTLARQSTQRQHKDLRSWHQS